MESASIKTLIDIFPHQLRHFPQEAAIAAKKGPPADHEDGDWKHYSSLKCMDYINKVSKGLLAIGVRKGDKIAIVSENRPEWIFLDNGMLQLGAINVPLYPTLSKDEYKYILNEAEVKIVFASNKTLYDRVNAVKDQVPSLEQIMTFDEVPGGDHWNTLLEHAGEKALNEVVALREKVQPDDLATIIYTSGTTGKPKGVMLTHKNIVSNVVNCEPLLPVKYRHKALSFLPLNHVFERMLTYLYLSSGVSVYQGDDLDKVGEYMREVEPHIFTSVPRLVEKVYERILGQGRQLKGIQKRIFLYALKIAEEYEISGKSWWYKKQLQFCDKLVFSKWREALGGNVRTIVSGSAPLSPKLQRIFTAAGIPILEGYGLTETSPVIAVNRMEKEYRKFGTVGPLIDECEVKIAEDGEILVKGPNVMQGYYKNEEATKQVFDDEGWFHTGDVGEFDGTFLMVKDRKDDMFKTAGGKFVAPQPIENKFKESLFIQQIIVIGQNRKFVSALIVPDFDHLAEWCKNKNIPYESKDQVVQNPKVQQKLQEVVDFYNKNFGHVQQVKKFKLLTRQFLKEEDEVTPTMKLKRPAIKQHFQKEIEALYKDEE